MGAKEKKELEEKTGWQIVKKKLKYQSIQLTNINLYKLNLY